MELGRDMRDCSRDPVQTGSARLRQAASLGFCLSVGHLWTALPSSASLLSALLRRALQPVCSWKSLSGHQVGDLVYFWLLHESRRWMGVLRSLEMEALLGGAVICCFLREGL